MRHGLFVFANRWLVGYLAFLSAFAPISTDMYLPALPHMAEALRTDYGTISLTISLFILLFSLSMLVWGPLSDRYGRRPVMLAGSALYIAGSLGVVFSDSFAPLLCWRGLQAVGSGALSAMSLAVVKDILRGGAMERVVTWMQTVTILAPMLAPVAGGWLLLAVDWRGIFFMLTLCGGLALLGALGLRETRPIRYAQGSVLAALGRIFAVLGNRNFSLPLLLFSAMSMPLMAYLGVSSYVFQRQFGLSAQAYSWFFAGNAAVGLLGPVLHMRLFRHMRRDRVISFQLSLVLLGGALLLFAGDLGPWPFALAFALISFGGSAIRPPSTVLMLESINGDTGAVTALINSFGLLFGSFSMFLATLPVWSGPVMAAGCLSVVVASLALAGWILLVRAGLGRPARS